MTDESSSAAAYPAGRRITKGDVEVHVRAYLTPKGVRMWWLRPAWQLGEQTPAQAWEGGRKQEVYDFALGGRSGGGT